MKLEHKIGITITCTFLCLTGAVIGLKMQEQTPQQSPKVAGMEPPGSDAPMPETKKSVPLDKIEMPPPDLCSHASDGKASDDSLHRIPPPDSDKTQDLGNKVPTSKLEPKKNPSAGASLSLPTSIEPKPTAPPVIGADEWGQSSRTSREKKPKEKSAAPANEPKPTNEPKIESALPLAVSEEKKPQQPTDLPSAPIITPVGSTATPTKPADSQAKPAAASVSPRPESSPSTPAASSNSTNGPATSGLTFPPFLPDKPENSPKPQEPGTNGKPSPASPAPTNQQATPVISPASVSPTGPPAAPASATPTPPPSATTMTPASPTVLKPTPVAEPGPTATPAPVPAAPPAAPPTPPKPPADGSAFIPDNSSAATGPVGVKPAPLPFPTLPPLAPLAAAPDKPAPVQPASNGPSVMVYDEQDYTCRSGDTWEEISKRFYLTDRYAKALQRHNQNHARASDRLRDTGQLAPGERIFVPQAYVLEERYADAIPRPAAAPPSTTTPATFVAPSGSPPPVPPTMPHP